MKLIIISTFGINIILLFFLYRYQKRQFSLVHSKNKILFTKLISLDRKIDKISQR